MINFLRAFLFILICMSLLILPGCATEECDGNRSALPLAGFYSSSNPRMSYSPIGLQIGGIGAPADSLLIKSSQSQAYLPFRIDRDSTLFFISSQPDEEIITDTIMFRYDIEPYFVSSACGAVYNYRLRQMRHTYHAIDSIVCIDSLFTYADRQQLRIYFKDVL